MTTARRARWQKATALVPLALLSAAWTANLVGVGSAIESAHRGPATLPDGTVLPTEVYGRPASYAPPGTAGLGVPSGRGDAVVATASTNGIPSAALSAYQRAETVMNAADKACNIPWQLIAAIGRIESDHGRYAGNTLGTDGVSRPGIFGIPLDGTRNTAEIADTDAGQYDNDAVWDRAVGPMQFIPSTWLVVGVDADGDAKRNPQDIDDAALAAAVYLCPGSDTEPGADLSTEAGQRKSVFRYNHSEEYVDLVLSIMEAYMDGDYTSVPNDVTSAVTFTADYSAKSPSVVRDTRPPLADGRGGAATPANGSSQPAAEQPAEPPASQPAEAPGDPIAKGTKVLMQPLKTLTTLLTLPQAVNKCTALGYSPLLTRAAWNECIAENTSR